MALRDKFIKFLLGDKLEQLEQSLKEKDEIIYKQKEELEKRDFPMHFAIPKQEERFFGHDVAKYRRIDFKVLRELSERYDVARACINRRKRQVESVDWFIQPINPKEKGKYEKQIQELTKFFKAPGGKYARFREFVNEVVEDLLVLDGAAIWKDKTIGGKLTKLVTVDAATIRLRVMEDGSDPEPPEPAFEQWIKGKKVAQFTTDEMDYLMLNPRSNTPYGFAPLEALILGVDAALRSQLYNLNMLTEGNIPEGFFALPDNWTPDQIKEFQDYFDALISGNPRFQQRIKFVPGGKGVGYIPAKKPQDMRFLEYEKWLLLKTCALFDVPPEEIGFTEEMSRATAQVQFKVALRSGLLPILQVLKEFFDKVIQEDFGYEGIEWVWSGLDEKDEEREAKIAKLMIPMGAISVDEWRIMNDLPPIGLGHYIMTGQGPILVEDLLRGSPQPQKEKEKFVNFGEVEKLEKEIEEIEKWRTKALNDVRKKRKFRPFESIYIDENVKKIIESELLFAESKEEVKNIFDTILQGLRKEKIMLEAKTLKEDLSHTLQEYEKEFVKIEKQD